jgi:hypothetical protein
VRPSLVRPRQGRAGLGRERPGRVLHLRGRRRLKVPQQTRPGSHMSRAPGKTNKTEKHSKHYKFSIRFLSPISLSLFTFFSIVYS